MKDETLNNFVRSTYDDVVQAMNDADENLVNDQYRLGIRRVAKAFFDNYDLYDMRAILPELPWRDVDAWFAGRKQQP